MSQSETSLRYASSDVWLADHQVNGQYVLPGAIEVEMMLAMFSGGQLETPIRLSNVQFTRFMGLREHGTLHVQMSRADDQTRFVFSAETDLQPNRTTIATASAHTTTLSPPHAPQLACPTSVASPTVYARFAENGIRYGKFFQSMSRIALGDGCARVDIEIDTAHANDHWILHPSVMDAALQAMSLALQSPIPPEQLTTCVPLSIEALTIWRPIREPVQVLAWRTDVKGTLVTGDFLLVSHAGAVLATATGVRMRRSENNVGMTTKTPARTIRHASNIAHQVEWHPAPTHIHRDLPTGAWLLFSAGTHEDDALAEALRAKGNRVVVITQAHNASFADTACTINPANEADFPQLFKWVDETVQGVIYRWGGGKRQQIETRQHLESQITSLLSALFYCIKALGRQQRRAEFYLLTTEAQWIPGRRALHPLRAAMLGIGRVLAIENAKFRVRLIDFAGPDVKSAEMLNALTNDNQEVEVAYHKGQCFVPTVQPISAQHVPEQVFRNRGNYLIIGGQGGIGLEVARHLTKNHAKSLILLNRSSPSAERLAAIEALAVQSGVEIWAAQGDVTSLHSMRQVWHSAEARFGEIHGIFHCAGILRDGLMRSKTSDNFHAVLKPKIQGSWVLSQLCLNRKLDFVMLFGSVSGVFGNLGQGSYAAANVFQDALALYQSQLHKQPWISLDWGLWGEVGMGLEVADQLIRRGVQPLTTQEALAELAPAIASGVGQRIIAHHKPKPKPHVAVTKAKTVVTASQENLVEPKSIYAREQQLQTDLRIYLAQKLATTPARIEADVPFSEFGIDSILAITMTEELSKRWHRDFPATLFLEYATLEELAEVLVEQYKLPDKSPDPNKTSATTVETPEHTANPLPAIKEETVPDTTRPVVQSTSTPASALAVVAMSGRFPDAADLDAYWALIKEGRVVIREVPHNRWEINQWYETQHPNMQGTYARWGGFLDGIDQFDPAFFRMSPREARELDPQQRLVLEQVWRVLENGGMVGETEIGVFVAATYTHHRDTYGLNKLTPYSALGGMNALIPNRVSYAFNLTGPSMMVDTLCSSSLVAINHALKSIAAGECKAAVVVGVQVGLTPWYYRSLSQLGALSPEGVCAPFDQSANGFVPGEGVAALLLRPLADAEQARDPILGIIRTCRVNHGGRAAALTVPRKQGQAAVIRAALADAGISSAEIGYLEAHGTGTPLGDPIEIAALVEAFADTAPQNCAIGSVKANIGHLEPAAGLASIVKVLLAFREKTIPPLAQFKIPNEHIHFENTPFYIPETAQPWDDTQSQHAAVSSFGMGGTNAHVVLSPYVAPQYENRSELKEHILTFSARSHTALIKQINAICTHLETSRDALVDIAYSRNVGRGHFKTQRAVVIGRTHHELIAACQTAIKQGPGVYWDDHAIVPVPTENTGQDVSAYVPLSFSEIKQMVGWHQHLPTQLAQSVTLAQLYVQGIEISWRKLYATYTTRRVSLPTYPFEKRTLRPVNQSSPTHAQSSLTTTSPVVMPTQPPERIPADKNHPLWADHRINGESIFPATAHLTAMLGNHPLPVRIDDVMLLNPLIWSTNLPSVQTHEGGKQTIEQNGTLYAQATISSIIPPARAPIAPLELAETIHGDAIYAWYAETGSIYGASMRVIQQGQFAGEQIVVHLHATAAHKTAALLDGVLQSAAVLTMQLDTPSSFRPYAIYGLELWQALPTDMICLFERSMQTSRALEGSCQLFDSGWRQIGRIEQIVYLNTLAVAPDPHRTHLQESQTRKRLLLPLRNTIARHLEMALDDLLPTTMLADIGLDSIVAASISADLQAQFNIRLTPVDILDEITPESLAVRLLELGAQSANNGVPSEQPQVAPPEPSTPQPQIAPPTQEIPDDAIAIIGAAGRFPEADSLEQYWENLAAGRDSVGEIPAERWGINQHFDPSRDKRGTTYSRWGAFLNNPDHFDATFFDIYPRQAKLMDPQQRLLLETAWHAIEDAGLAGGQLSANPTAVYIAASYQHYREYNIEPAQLDAYSGPGNQNAFLANRLSYVFDLKGPCMTVDTLCSSSLVALNMAAKSLLLGECQQALVGAVQVGISPIHYQSLSRLRALSPSGRCRTFDASADGFVPGEGVGVVVLKRLDDAVTDGDPILGVIRGSAVNHNGRSQGITVPNSNGQSDVIRMALAQANVPSTSISYVEAHGTGTALGDPVEVEGLCKAYHADKKQSCAIGSVKSNIGHLESAAGMAGLIKVLLAFKNEQIPPSLHMTHANPDISFEDSPFYVSDRLLDWKRGATPRRAALSAFGLGGVNAHVILEEAPQIAIKSREEQAAILHISAKSERALGNLVQSHVAALRQLDDSLLQNYCHTVNTGRGLFEHRLAVSGVNSAEIAQNLQAAYANWQPASRATPIETCFIFGEDDKPYHHIVASLQKHKAFRKIYAQFALNDDKRIIAFATQYALARLLIVWGIMPDCTYGSGIGEYVAACIAGALEPEIAIAALRDPEQRLTLDTPIIPLRTAGNYLTNTQTLPKWTIAWSFTSKARDQPETLTPCDPKIPTMQALYAALARYVTMGGAVNWHTIESERPTRLKGLPLYPFASRPYWHKHTPTPTDPASNQKRDKEQFLSNGSYPAGKSRLVDIRETGQFKLQTQKTQAVEVPSWQLTWEPAHQSDALLYLPRGTALIFADSGGVGAKVAYELERIGLTPLIIYRAGQVVQGNTNSYTFAPEDVAQIDQLLQAQAHPLVAFLHLWQLDDTLSNNALTAFKSEMQLWQMIVQRLHHRDADAPARLLLATRNGQVVDAAEAAALDPYRHALTHFVQTLSAENKVRGLTIDLDHTDPHAAALMLIGEMVHDAPAAEISWRNQQRFQRSVQPIVHNSAPLTLQSRDAFLITGGLGGVGFQQAQALIAQGLRHLAISGRSELNTNKQIRLNELSATGCDVIYLRGDVTNEMDIQRMLADSVAKFGLLTGIVHTAGGSGQFGSILRKPWEQIHSTLAPKLRGTDLLLSAAKQYSSIHTLILTSSIASLSALTGFGLAEYGVANRYLNGLALRGNHTFRIISQIWPEWRSTGFSQNLVEDHKLLPSISVAEGRQLFKQSVGGSVATPLLLQTTTDVQMLQSILDGTYVVDTPQLVQDGISAETAAVPSPPSIDIETLMHTVSQIIQDVLHIETAIDWSRSFVDLGMDSLAIADVIARLERQFNHTLNPALLLRQPNLETLTRKLYEEGVGRTEQQTAAAPIDQTLESTFSAILDGLADDASLDDAVNRLLAHL